MHGPGGEAFVPAWHSPFIYNFRGPCLAGSASCRPVGHPRSQLARIPTPKFNLKKKSLISKKKPTPKLVAESVRPIATTGSQSLSYQHPRTLPLLFLFPLFFLPAAMVCTKCEKKLGKVIVPDKWKEGASNTLEGGGRKINENKLLSKKNRWTPYGNTKCVICKQQVHQDGKYCHTCAYSKGVCAMCGKQVLDTKLYKQSNV
ncbi:hypothetical protein ACQ4PT_047558 [Festuca glaucescens]